MNNNQYIQDCVEDYRDTKEAWIIKFNKTHGTTSEFCKKWGVHGLKRKRPWYMLSKGDRIKINSKEKPKRLNRTELMEAYVQRKYSAWLEKHPCPVKKDDNDIFYDFFYKNWKELCNENEERIRNEIISKYDKLHLIGRFSSSNELFHEQEIAQIRDDGETAKHGGVNNLPENSKVMKKARIITNKVKAKRGNLICTNLKDHKKQRGRILLPNMKVAA